MAHSQRFPAAFVTALLLAASPGHVRADYVCQPLDVPGAAWTQVWQLNSTGAVAAGSDLGGRVYSGGGWLPLPPLPAGSGFASSEVAALGINDAGVTVGVAGPDTSQQAFILSGSTYAFFSYRPDLYTGTEARAISNSGLVTGVAYNQDGGTGFVYNPSAAPRFAAGYTEIVPTLPDGTVAWRTIPNGINSAGQFVGSADFNPGGRYGFLYDPDWRAQGASKPLTLFQLDGAYTAPRGIDNAGRIVGFTRAGGGGIVGFLLTAQGHQLITCPGLDAANGLYLESINDSGVISGMRTDAAGVNHGLLIFPDVTLPVTSVDGAFVFDAAVSPSTPVFLDPEPAVGYQYAIGEGNPLFTSVTLPIGVGDDVYTVLAQGRAFHLAGGQRLDFTQSGFPSGLASFAVMGIEKSAGVDANDPNAFVTEVTFGAGGNGRFTGTMTALTPASELADLAAAATAVGPGQSLVTKLRRAQTALAAGDVTGTCAALGTFVAEVSAQAGKHVGAMLADALVAEAHEIEGAVGCP